MTLKEHIDDIRNNLEQGLFTNEAAVSNGIVRRLLDALDWPIYNPQIIIPEYSVEGRRVDFALCHPPSKPIAFIEVKQVGNIEGAERQLFEYAFHEGIPIAILTDGQEWRFFHPIAPGDYRERKVYELNLSESNSEENAKYLNRYLNYESMCTGEAVEAIKKDYKKVVQQRQVETHLPEVWNELVREKNEDLLLIVMDAAKNKIGYEPTEEQVLDFLKSLERNIESHVTEIPSPTILPGQPTQRRTRRTQKAPQTRLVVTMSDGKVIDHHSATRTWIETILSLGPNQVIRVDPEERLISTTPKFRKNSQHGQYYIAKDYGTVERKRLLDRIAGRLGIQLRVEIVAKS